MGRPTHLIGTANNSRSKPNLEVSCRSGPTVFIVRYWMISWSAEILQSYAVLQEMEVLTRGKFAAVPSFPGATELEIKRAETSLNRRFDERHRTFLLFANGWDEFYGPGIDLFSTADFMGSPRFQTATKWVSQMDRGVLGAYSKQKSKLFPIAKSSHSTDLLLMLDEGGQLQARVLWVANELIEDFESFDEMFVSLRQIRQSLNAKMRAQP